MCVGVIITWISGLDDAHFHIRTCIHTIHFIHTDPPTPQQQQVYVVLDPPATGKAGPPPQSAQGGRPKPQHVTSMVALGPDILATGSSDGTLKVWTVNPPQPPGATG